MPNADTQSRVCQHTNLNESDQPRECVGEAVDDSIGEFTMNRRRHESLVPSLENLESRRLLAVTGSPFALVHRLEVAESRAAVHPSHANDLKVETLRAAVQDRLDRAERHLASAENRMNMPARSAFASRAVNYWTSVVHTYQQALGIDPNAKESGDGAGSNIVIHTADAAIPTVSLTLVQSPSVMYGQDGILTITRSVVTTSQLEVNINAIASGPSVPGSGGFVASIVGTSTPASPMGVTTTGTTSGKVTILPNQASVTIYVYAWGDSGLGLGDDTVSISLPNPPTGCCCGTGTPPYTVSSPNSASLTLIHSDISIKVNGSASATTSGGSPGTPATFVVHRSGNTSQPLTIPLDGAGSIANPNAGTPDYTYTTTGGSASLTSSGGSVSFPAGSSDVSIVITPQSPTVPVDKSINLAVHSGSNGQCVPSAGAGYGIVPSASSAVLTIAHPALVATGRAITSAVVATFTDADPSNRLGNYTAQIKWYDNSTVAGSIVAEPGIPGKYDVLGTFNYTTAGTFPVVIRVDDIFGRTSTANSTALVVDASPTLTLSGDGVYALGGSNYEGVVGGQAQAILTAPTGYSIKSASYTVNTAISDQVLTSDQGYVIPLPLPITDDHTNAPVAQDISPYFYWDAVAAPWTVIAASFLQADGNQAVAQAAMKPAAKAQVDGKTPRVNSFTDTISPFVFGPLTTRANPPVPSIGFHQGDLSQNPKVLGNSFTANVTTPVHFPGLFAITQTIDETIKNTYKDGTTLSWISNGFVLDNTAAGFASPKPFIYAATLWGPVAANLTANLPGNDDTPIDDSPSYVSALTKYTPPNNSTITTFSIDQVFHTYLAYLNTPTGKWVEISEIDWELHGKATLKKNPDGSLMDGTIAANWTVTGPAPGNLPSPSAGQLAPINGHNVQKFPNYDRKEPDVKPVAS